MVITNKGMLIRMPARDISVIGRNTQGVRLIDIGEAGELVVGLTRVAAEEAAEGQLPTAVAEPEASAVTNGEVAPDADDAPADEDEGEDSGGEDGDA
jgi:DNA gyrase subunit A